MRSLNRSLWIACLAPTIAACLPTLHGPGDAAPDVAGRDAADALIDTPIDTLIDAPADSLIDAPLDTPEVGSDAMVDVPEAGDDGTAVTGTSITTYVLPGASPMMVPADLSAVMVEALVYSGSSWQHFAGAGARDGTFRIPGVPQGTYVLHVGQTFVYTSQRAVDVGGLTVGRPDATQVSADPTNVVFTLSGMQPWTDGSMLEAFSPSANAWAFGLETTAQNAPAPSDAMLTAFTVNWFNQPRILGTRGDLLSLMELSAQPPTTDGTQVTSATKIYTAPAFDMIEGQPTTLNGAFTDIPQSRTLQVDWRRSSYENFRTAVNPSAVTVSQLVSVQGLPGGFANGRISATADLLTVVPGAIAGTDLNVGAVAWGNPFPTTYGIFAGVFQTFRVRYMLAGASASNAFAEMFYEDDPSVLSAGPMTVKLSPPRNVTVNGMDAFSNATALTTTPAVTWDAPITGTADYYVLNVYKISGGTSMRSLVATVITTATNLVLPPFIVQPGDSFTLTLEAVWAPGVDITRTPGVRYHLPQAVAETLSGILQP